jgi:uncharacterized protein YndB with AHSA1/START domain
MPPSQESLFRIFINAPAELVFDYLADARNMERWSPGTGKVELDTAGAIGLGTRFRFHGTGRRGTGKFHEVIVAECERPVRLVFVVQDDYFEDIRQEYFLRPLEGGTILQRRVFTSMNLAHALLARLLMGALVRPLYENALPLLKRAVEAKAREGRAGRP